MQYDCNAIDNMGKRIKERCQQLGLSYPALAEKVFQTESKNCNTKTLEQNRKNICNYANGHFPKDPAIYLHLCNALECDIEYLFGIIDYPRKEVLNASQETGLSTKSVEVIKSEMSNNDMLDRILAHQPSLLHEILDTVSRAKAIYTTSKNNQTQSSNKKLIELARSYGLFVLSPKDARALLNREAMNTFGLLISGIEDNTQYIDLDEL